MNIPLPVPLDQHLSNKRTKTFCDWRDWEDLKETFASAAEDCESDNSSRALATLRAVVHECHRFIQILDDPSILFTSRRTQLRRTDSDESAHDLTPPEERLNRDWGVSSSRTGDEASANATPSLPSRPPDLPTAFHVLLGMSLFLFGNLIAQDPSLATGDEPTTPSSYWLSAVDVFQISENLPTTHSHRSRSSNSSTSSRPFEIEQTDWRIGIVWGRTLVSLADEKLRSTLSTPASPQPIPTWPPLRAIAARRPPGTTTPSTFTPSDYLLTAHDQLSRGIFHMPHPPYLSSHSHIFARARSSSGLGLGSSPHPFNPLPQTLTPASQDSTFSRAKELYTIASEVLSVAERLPSAKDRTYWAKWADAIFKQMKDVGEVEAWRARICLARGRCWLVGARVEELEDALEREQSTDGMTGSVLESKEAQEARQALETAISFFERVKGPASTSNDVDMEMDDVRPLLAEALLSLANITIDESKREELYARAEAEGGARVDLDPPLQKPSQEQPPVPLSLPAASFSLPSTPLSPPPSSATPSDGLGSLPDDDEVVYMDSS
ncbi:uncharacterized protein STEHIDRAFT_57984 [Stereum hirsutum FP-91666 SS1]|uniref:uncharacterized protein n=1 Tax=Stereum hirsutum (strain FP-91666) TaxID=721885 RepID=UPI000440A2EB|nr:uncharacterized protein STEHIDRAFT_57984 [Stereum hirsutum FP-91666 SS1]EIM86942.1 hypothetical protein STEHIDRAFT_57984 [Stereum hirsutum FP-91666 SS1]